MENLNIFSSINERDIDLVLLEELNVSESFSNWLVTRVTGLPGHIKLVGAWHSVSDNVLGESDLVFIYESEDSSHQAILIENKVDALAQPTQAIRYQQRGKAGIEQGHWVDFITCLIAPQKYLDKTSEIYHTQLSYEEIMAYFVSDTSARGMYKAKLMKNAIDKQRRGYKSTVSNEMTLFARLYLDYVQERYPELNPESSKPRAAGNTWIRFYPNPKDKLTQIVHQIYGNTVKIMMYEQAENFDLISQRFTPLVDDSISIYVSGKSVIFEASAPEIDPINQRFSDVFPEIEESIRIALQLKQVLKLASI
ncbi:MULTISPECIES: PD-(D/E)XK nuclease superfamily protein [Vibrio harveyi group]|uniref:PD-(D/E)XK nuclease superfamily protein n=1 Tax=Vibrio harveyi group TaxID=717610 RepID=UPI0028947615|nr:PD-(D/E)XK nuclease superfamily protein [Vibrio rotiferianus]